LINYRTVGRTFFSQSKAPALSAWLFFFAFWAKGQVPFDCRGQFFIGVNGTGNSTLYAMNADPTGTGLLIFPPNLTVNSSNAIGFNKKDHLIYGYESGKLFTLDKNGFYTEISNVQVTAGVDYFGGDVSPDGKYYTMVGGKTVNGIYQDVELVKIDLEDPQFGQTILPVSGEIVRSFDIAFDPTNGLLYGLDVNKARIFTLDSETGAVMSVFPSDPSGQVAGALFFDGFGNLFSYGTFGSPLKNTLYSIDKNTGAMQVIASGPGSGGGDGCSCPYTVSLAKSVFPESVYSCSEVVYAFTLHNLSGETLSGLTLEDHLPTGFEIVGLSQNLLGGQAVSGIGSGHLKLINMALPPGVFTIEITVEVGDIPAGIYKNQASISGIPTLLGGNVILSDNPLTTGQVDSTSLEVVELGFEELSFFDTICQGDTLRADASGFGQKFLWQDGSTDAAYLIAQGGTYWVQAIAGCDTAHIFYHVHASYFEVVDKAAYQIESGDTVTFFPSILNEGNSVQYQWADPWGNSLSCLDCPNPTARPLENAEYLLIATNEHGCRDSAFFSVMLDKTRRVYAPNAFSPNGDGINDLFFLQGKSTANVNYLKVFSRWGNLVFDGKNAAVNDMALGWDGYFIGKKMPAGVYAWLAEVAYLDGQREILKGDVMLLP
jgi:gliding motility-associated-like protein